MLIGRENINKHLNNINYRTLLNILLEEKDYEELVSIGKGILLDIPIYKENDEILKKNFDKTIASGIKGDFFEQNQNARTFRHITIKKKFYPNLYYVETTVQHNSEFDTK